MRILVTGDREWTDFGYNKLAVSEVLQGLYEERSVGYLVVDVEPFVVIEGGAKGADDEAKRWCVDSPLHPYPVYTTLEKYIDGVNFWHVDFLEKHNKDFCPVVHYQFPAKWGTWGKAAGPMRNQQMLDEGKPDLVIGFHNNIQESRGTKDMLNRSKKAGIKTLLISEW